MSTPRTVGRLNRERFTRALAQKFFLRFHISLIVAFTFCAGFIASKGLYALGLNSMPVRYSLALAGAYLAFLLACRLWIYYVSLFGQSSRTGPVAGVGDGGSGGIDLTDLNPGLGGGSSGGGGAGQLIRAGGGDFSGGGASGDFDAPTVAALSGSSSSGSGSGSSWFGGGGGSSFDVDDDGLALILLIAVLAAIFGTVAYILYAGPAILANCAFETLVAGGFVRRARMLEVDWLGSLFKSTWIPLAVLLITLAAFGHYAQKAYPDAHTAREVFVKIIDG